MEGCSSEPGLFGMCNSQAGLTKSGLPPGGLALVCLRRVRYAGLQPETLLMRVWWGCICHLSDLQMLQPMHELGRLGLSWGAIFYTSPHTMSHSLGAFPQQP